MGKESKSKLYAVHIITTLPTPNKKFVHVGVKQYYKDKNRILYIEEEKRESGRVLYKYGLDHIKEIRVREVIKGKI